MERKIKSWENRPLAPEELMEIEKKLKGLFYEILNTMGYDLENDPNMVDTPKRMARMFLELTEGNFTPPPPITVFNLEEMGQKGGIPVFVGPIEIKSLCSHHFLPIVGEVYFEYVPKSRVLGLSKIPRLIKWLARRPMIQELFTGIVLRTFEELLPDAEGFAVHVRAKHMCMTVRGVNESNAYMITEAFSGVYSENPILRESFLKKVPPKDAR